MAEIKTRNKTGLNNTKNEGFKIFKSQKATKLTANNIDGEKAELKLLKNFIDEDIIEYKQHNVKIKYNHVPLSVEKERKMKEHKRRNSLLGSLFLKTSKYDDKTEKLNDKSKDNKINYKTQHIHTMSFKLKKKFKEVSRKNSIDDLLKKVEVYEKNYPKNIVTIQANLKKNKGKGMGVLRKKREYNIQKNVSSHSLKDLADIIKQENVDDKSDIPLVLTHGYASAAGMYIHTIHDLYKTLNDKREIHVIDWFGNGMSSRPEFLCQTTEEAEDWFIESLNEWRKEMKIEKMILLGHSLGGYLSCCYAMKYPQYIDHLILVSPAGMKGKPKEGVLPKDASWKLKWGLKTAERIWNKGVTPHDIVKKLPNSRKIIHKIVHARLFRLPHENDPEIEIYQQNSNDDDNNNNDNNETKTNHNIDVSVYKKNKIFKTLLTEYLYHVICQKGSGEYALNKILWLAKFANKPLCNRIGKLKEYQLKNNLKIDFIFGETDWIRSDPALTLKCNKVIFGNIYTVPDAGHQLVVENGKHFAKIVGGIVKKGHNINYVTKNIKLKINIQSEKVSDKGNDNNMNVRTSDSNTAKDNAADNSNKNDIYYNTR